MLKVLPSIRQHMFNVLSHHCTLINTTQITRELPALEYQDNEFDKSGICNYLVSFLLSLCYGLVQKDSPKLPKVREHLKSVMSLCSCVCTV